MTTLEGHPATRAPRATPPAPPAHAGLHAGFEAAVARHPARPALECGGERLSYSELHTRAVAVAAALQGAVDRPEGADPPLTAVLAYRTPSAFAGVLGALMAGHAYVPLNPTLPARRNLQMVDASGCAAVVADAGSLAELEALLALLTRPLTVLVPDAEVRALAARWPQHHVLGQDDVVPPTGFASATPAPGDLAYVLFTSGSTGVPKGVQVSHANVCGLLETMVARYGLDERDRISQTHELTFDVSVWDMFVTWRAAACLCCPTRKELIKPGGFIRDARLTVWFSVPSTAIFMRRLGMLKPGAYPGLRHSLFAGEPLPVGVAEAWERAAPASTVENLYGPTELTIVCMAYVFSTERSPAECEAGVLPIGRPLPGMRPLVVDEQLHEVPAGSVGELLVTGPQMTGGYWCDPRRTSEVFVVPPGRDAVHYRTGDRVRRPRGEDPMTYLGRVDDQLKVRGVRVEPGEVEAVLREVSGVDAVVVVGWPITPTGVDGLVAFVGSADLDAARLAGALRERLPVHMVPREVRLLDQLPLNASGKFDRLVLRRSLG